MKEINIGTPIDLEKLLTTRLLIQAASGGGKSYAVRKTIESVGNKVQQIVLDSEAEYISLREKFDFVLIGKGGDIPVSLKYAEVLAHKLLETGLSAIIDLSELKQHERVLFVKRFLDALIHSPESLWHSCLIYLDEAHLYCPEGVKSESAASVIDLCTRGRKRGFAAVLATQRLSKLNKSAAADCLNKMIGQTGGDIDRKRAGEELGLYDKASVLNLRNMEPGEFYAFGPAISREVIKFKVAKVITTHLVPGKRMLSNPPTPAAVKKILSKLADIPAEAEKELISKQQMQSEITRLRGEVTRLTNATAPGKEKKADDIEIDRLKKQVLDLYGRIEQQSLYIKEKEKNESYYIASISEYKKGVMKIKEAVWPLTEIIIVPETPTKFAMIKGSMPATTTAKNYSSNNKEKVLPMMPPGGIGYISDKNGNTKELKSPVGGSLRMLQAAAQFYPKEISRPRMGVLARLSHKSGSFSTYISSLKTQGYITGDSKNFSITEAGLAIVGNFEPLPTDPATLIEMWCGIMGNNNGAARMLKSLGEVYPDSMTKEQLGEAVGMSHKSGSFGTYLSKLRTPGLIKVEGQTIKASEEMFGD